MFYAIKRSACLCLLLVRCCAFESALRSAAARAARAAPLYILCFFARREASFASAGKRQLLRQLHCFCAFCFDIIMSAARVALPLLLPLRFLREFCFCICCRALRQLQKEFYYYAPRCCCRGYYLCARARSARKAAARTRAQRARASVLRFTL